MHMRNVLPAVAGVMLLVPASQTYPLDGAAKTGIRRLNGYRLVHEGKIKGAFKLPPGALLGSDEVVLRLKGSPFNLGPDTPKDPYLQSGLERIFGGRSSSYAVAMLDMSDPAKPLYAALRGEDKKIPGSVGKLCVVTGLFGAVAANLPAVADRQKFLRETMVDADSFIFTDGKTVPFYQDGDPGVVNRVLRLGDPLQLVRMGGPHAFAELEFGGIDGVEAGDADAQVREELSAPEGGTGRVLQGHAEG